MHVTELLSQVTDFRFEALDTVVLQTSYCFRLRQFIFEWSVEGNAFGTAAEPWLRRKAEFLERQRLVEPEAAVRLRVQEGLSMSSHLLLFNSLGVYLINGRGPVATCASPATGGVPSVGARRSEEEGGEFAAAQQLVDGISQYP